MLGVPVLLVCVVLATAAGCRVVGHPLWGTIYTLKAIERIDNSFEKIEADCGRKILVLKDLDERLEQMALRHPHEQYVAKVQALRSGPVEGLRLKYASFIQAAREGKRHFHAEGNICYAVGEFDGYELDIKHLADELVRAAKELDELHDQLYPGHDDPAGAQTVV